MMLFKVIKQFTVLDYQSVRVNSPNELKKIRDSGQLLEKLTLAKPTRYT
jgi:hypothetical protein